MAPVVDSCYPSDVHRSYQRLQLGALDVLALVATLGVCTNEFLHVERDLSPFFALTSSIAVLLILGLLINASLEHLDFDRSKSFVGTIWILVGLGAIPVLFRWTFSTGIEAIVW